MYRLIYLEPESGYKSIDSKCNLEIHENVAKLGTEKIHVICIVDYLKQSIKNKCEDFSNHSDSIDGIIFDPAYVTQF